MAHEGLNRIPPTSASPLVYTDGEGEIICAGSNRFYTLREIVHARLPCVHYRLCPPPAEALSR